MKISIHKKIKTSQVFGQISSVCIILVVDMRADQVGGGGGGGGGVEDPMY